MAAAPLTGILLVTLLEFLFSVMLSDDGNAITELDVQFPLNFILHVMSLAIPNITPEMEGLLDHRRSVALI